MRWRFATSPVFSHLCAALFCGALLTPKSAYAQANTFYLDRLQVGGAPADGVAVWNPEIDGTRAFIQAALGVAYKPLRTENIVYDQGDVRSFQGPPVTHQFIVYATVGTEIKNRVLLSATLPMLFSQNGFPTLIVSSPYKDAVSFEPSTLFDLRLEGRVSLFESEKKFFRLGVRGAVFLPTGDEKSFTGDTGVWGQLGFAADWRTKRISSTLNLGLSLRPDGKLNAFEVGNEFNYALGIYVPITERVRLGGELFGSAGLTERTRGENNAPLEFSLNIRYARGKKKLRGWLGLAGGARLTDGYAPDFRIVATAGIAIPPDVEKLLQAPPPQDTDGDGYADDADVCPLAPEDGVRPGDGCPEKPIDPDRDHDGIKNRKDTCPDNPEDADDIDDEDGCPEEDADGDLVLDTDDKCPKEAGVSGADPEKEGCPQFVTRVETTIEIRQPIEFGFDTATIETRSHPILREIAQVLTKNPQIRVSIEGHTDDVGTDEYNEQLSKNRALAVLEHLVGLGIDRRRLSAKWFGKTKPLVNDGSDEAQAQNRRVEFRIEQ